MKREQSFSKVNIGKKLILLAVLAAIAVIGVLLWQGFDHGNIDVSFYQINSDKTEENIRVVMIADLHSRSFGEGNCDLLETIEKLHPDLIAVVGDITIYPSKDYTVGLKLLVDLQEIAPVYYSYGNHEYSDILFSEGSTLRRQIAETGVNVVNNSSVTVEINNSVLDIGGICTGPKNFYDNAAGFLDKYVKSENFKLLLCHHPECFESCMEDYPIDLALSGHAHGGQIRLPFVGGLFSPDQGFFPDLTEGLQYRCGSPLVITRGLGNSWKLPRFNNNPEVVVIDILS